MRSLTYSRLGVGWRWLRSDDEELAAAHAELDNLRKHAAGELEKLNQAEAWWVPLLRSLPLPLVLHLFSSFFSFLLCSFPFFCSLLFFSPLSSPLSPVKRFSCVWCPALNQLS